jgi:hypothetical protein
MQGRLPLRRHGFIESTPLQGQAAPSNGGDVCCVFVLCDAVSLVVCKKVPEHNLKLCIFSYYKVNSFTTMGAYTCQFFVRLCKFIVSPPILAGSAS